MTADVRIHIAGWSRRGMVRTAERRSSLFSTSTAQVESPGFAHVVARFSRSACTTIVAPGGFHLAIVLAWAERNRGVRWDEDVSFE